MDEHGYKASLLPVKLKASLTQIPLWSDYQDQHKKTCTHPHALAQSHWLNCWGGGFEPGHQPLSCSRWGYEHIFYSYSATVKAISLRRMGHSRCIYNLNHFVIVPKAHLSRMVQGCLGNISKRNLCMTTRCEIGLLRSKSCVAYNVYLALIKP